MSNDDAIRRRAAALHDLVELRRPVIEAAAALRSFGWDSDVELITLTRADAVRLLAAYLDGAVQTADCVAWAEALDGRDDVRLEAGYEDQLKGFLFEIATPELSEPLTAESARRWLDSFNVSGR